MFVHKIVTSRFVIIYSHVFFRSLKFMCIYLFLRFYLHKRNSAFDTDAYSMRSERPLGSQYMTRKQFSKHDKDISR